MAALAGVGSYGIVFHTKIARSSRRACNFMIPKGECAPAVFSIPIARSTLRQRQATQGDRIGVNTLIRYVAPAVAPVRIVRNHQLLSGSDRCSVPYTY
jgi:hypothetical protein